MKILKVVLICIGVWVLLASAAASFTLIAQNNVLLKKISVYSEYSALNWKLQTAKTKPECSINFEPREQQQKKQQQNLIF